MRNIILAAGSIALISGAALAADLPPRMPPPAAFPLPALPAWTGFYLGVNVGGGWAKAQSDFTVLGGAPFASAVNSLEGAIGGGQIGYNWQNGPALFGVEADFQASGLKGTLNAPCPPGFCAPLGLGASFTQKMPWFGTVRARLGVATDAWLIYVTGGYAYARFDAEATATALGGAASISTSETRNGWTVGGGIEAALSRNWSAKVEYLYLDFGTSNISWAIPGLPVINDASKIHSNVARAGVNYRF
jgi:outer membrane immunogenic protein